MNSRDVIKELRKEGWYEVNQADSQVVVSFGKKKWNPQIAQISQIRIKRPLLTQTSRDLVCSLLLATTPRRRLGLFS